MVELVFLSGKKAGVTWTARRFPVQSGRSAKADLRLEDDGVWEEHLRLELNAGAGVVLHAREPALARVNGQAATEALLRSGDEIEIGSTKMRFWLGPMRQHGLRFRESFTWISIAAIC